MDSDVFRYGTHRRGNDYDGYMYSFNTSKGSNFASHLHKCYEIIHIMRGKPVYTVEGTEYQVSDGDIIITVPDELHSISFPRDDVYSREFLHIYPGFIERVPEIAGFFSRKKFGEHNRIPREQAEKYGLDRILEDIRAACENPSADTDMIVFANTVLFAAKAHRILTEGLPRRANKKTASRAGLIYGYIELHYRESINAETIAAATAMSETAVRRLFKKETGMTIKAYLTLRRVTAAKNMIMNGQKATNVFTRCGFGDYSTFYRAFVKYVGMSPDDFKHSND